jgi:acetyltransferase-like isoleucine patch superfamily enzyme
MKRVVYKILAKINRYIQRLWLSVLNDYYRTLLGVGRKQLEVSGLCQFDINGRLSVGNDIYIRSKNYNQVEISVRANAILSIYDNVFINQGVRISASKEICIRQNVLIGDEVIILDNDFHSAHGNPQLGKILIEENVWIGSRAIILKDVTIGRDSVIGAGAVVSKSIPPGCLAAGVPAKIVKRY